MTWQLDPELRALPSWRTHERDLRPREAEHPYDVKMRDDARIMREHEARCTVVGCCGDVESGQAVVICECGALRQHDKPHAYDNGTLSPAGATLEYEVLESVRKAMRGSPT